MRRLIVALLPALLAWSTFAFGAPNQAGVVKLAEGDARITPAGGSARPAKAGDAVNEGDTLATGKGEMHVTMQDTGFLVLRPNSRFQVESYKADGGADDKGIFRLFAGGLRSISGWIGKYGASSYQVRTPTATIGIRGTDHETYVIPEGSSEGEAGTYDRVYAGETYIETPEGKAPVSPNQAGFVSSRPRERPRLLAQIPKFYRPGPHEAEINLQHAEIQKQIDQRRLERQKVIREKRAALGEARAKTKEMMESNKAAIEQGKLDAQAANQEIHARREKLGADQKQAKAMFEDLQASRKKLQEDMQGGQLPMKELRERRRANHEKEVALKALNESIVGQRKELQAAVDAKADKQLNATEERLKAMRGQVQDSREKRKSLDEEKASTKEEIKGLQHEEGKRYKEELKKDRSGGG